MEMFRTAKRPGAEEHVIMHEREPELLWDVANNGMVLRAENIPSWKDDGNHYDYEVFLTPADLERILRMMTDQA